MARWYGKYLKEVNYLVFNERKKLFGLLPLFLVSSFLDIVGISLLVGFVSLLKNQDSLAAGSSILRPLMSFCALFDPPIMAFSLMLFALFLFKTIFAILVNKTIFKVCFQFGVRLRAYLMYAYQKMDYVHYLRRNSSEYVYNIHTVAGQFSAVVIQSILKIVSEGLIGIVIIIYLATQNGLALLVLLFLLLMLAICYDKFFKRKNTNYGVLKNTYSTQLVKSIHEGMDGFRENHIFGITGFFNKKVTDNSRNLADIRIKSQLITTSPQYLIELTMVIFVVLLVFVTIITRRDTEILLTTISMFAIASARLIPSVNSILTDVTRLRQGRDTVSILYRDLKYISSDIDGLDFKDFDVKSMEHQKGEKLSLSHDGFETFKLENVGFSYSDREQYALRDVSIEIKRGDSVGIIGPSGSGKTTFVDVILGLLKPQEGEIFYNGKLLKDELPKWRAQVAYLPQDVFLIDDTLRRNVALGVSDDEIDDEQVINALRQAQLKELIERLPKGLDTVIGEHGSRLSGGQRQRIALARAFYYGRNVLVMDESTSALDTETEKEIIKEITMLKGVKTLIVVAHRLSTLKHCDVIYRIENGVITSHGSYDAFVSNL
jgi:ABC-type multidrug transport system fused ATPase/permease subunit